MERENKLHSIEISRATWRLIIWGMIIAGAVVWSYFTPSMSMSNEQMSWYVPSLAGALLIGFGFGLAYARVFKIEGIDE